MKTFFVERAVIVASIVISAVSFQNCSPAPTSTKRASKVSNASSTSSGAQVQPGGLESLPPSEESVGVVPNPPVGGGNPLPPWMLQPVTSPPAAIPAVPPVDTDPMTETCSASQVICEIYQAYLGRLPDNAGAMYWQGVYNSALRRGQSKTSAYEKVVQGVYGSVEFRSNGGVPATAAEIAEVQAQYNLFAAQIGVVGGQICLGNVFCSGDGIRIAIERLYQELLGRQMDPAGNTWVDRVADGQMKIDDVRRSILNSAEYLAKQK
jgi:hypothetical protein